MKKKVQFYSHSGQLDSALQVIEAALAGAPQDVELLFLKAQILQEKKDYDAAKESLKRIIVIDPDMKQAYNALGYLEYLQIKGKMTPKPSMKNIWLWFFKERRAIKYLKKALEIDSTYVEAKRNLALVYQNSLKKKNLVKAQKLMREIRALHPDNIDDLITMGEVELELGHFSRAEGLFLQVLERDSTNDIAHYHLGRIQLREDQIEKGTSSFYSALKYLKDPDLINDLFWDFRIIASQREKREYQSAQSKGAYLLKFWKSKDPSPTTLPNEFLKEFFRRIDYAREYFPSAAYRGFDDRGLVYIRYGEADERFFDPSEHPNIYWDSETWVYRNLAPGDVIFHFIRVGDIYHIIDNLSDALRVGQQNAPNILRLLEKRTHLSPIFARYYSEFQLVVSGDFKNSLRDIGTMDSRTMGLLSDMEQEIAEVREKAPPSAYRTEVAALPVVLAEAEFKAGRKVQHEIYFGIPYTRLSFQEGEDVLQSRVSVSVEIKDKNFETLNRYSFTRQIKAHKNKNMGRMYYLDQIVCQINPGEYHLGLSIENIPGNRKYMESFKINVLPFPDYRLTLSDIQISPQVRPRERIIGKAICLKDNFAIIPYPFLEIQRAKPYFVYFEIYNLTLNEDGEARFSVEYQVQRLEGKKTLSKFLAGLNPFGGGKISTLTVRNDRVEHQSNVAEYIALDFSKLREGSYLMKVVVRDQNAPGTSATTQRPFILR